jgi:hypothetical protein
MGGLISPTTSFTTKRADWKLAVASRKPPSVTNDGSDPSVGAMLRCLDMRNLDHASPFGNVGSDASGELSGRVDDWIETQRGQLAFVIEVADSICDLFVQLGNDRLWRPKWDEDAEQSIRSPDREIRPRSWSARRAGQKSVLGS